MAAAVMLWMNESVNSKSASGEETMRRGNR